VYAPDKRKLLPKKDKLDPVVFLLDWYGESSMAATLQALTDAKDLAGQKRSVYCLSRFVRTAGYGGETLYREARNAGIRFIKYENLSIAFDGNENKFTLRAHDGALEYEIVAGTVFAEGSREVTPVFANAAKALRIRASRQGYVTEDRFYLAPVLTTRRGVYHISRDVASERLLDGLNAILADAAAAECEDTEAKNTAIVDGKKCVFCYSCYRACPHGAMEPDVTARVMENLPTACQGCGICVAVCPGNAIELLRDEEPVLTDKSEKTLVLCCENSAEIALKEVLPKMGKDAADIELQPVPCGGRIGLEDMSTDLAYYGKVMVAVCVDDACKHHDGNKRACAQKRRLDEMLERSGIDAARVAYTQVSHALPGVLRDELTSFVKGETLA
jgi:heterodisulfide reductase subunit A